MAFFKNIIFFSQKGHFQIYDTNPIFSKIAQIWENILRNLLAIYYTWRDIMHGSLDGVKAAKSAQYHQL
jgi:hypothetical protein